MVSSIYNIVSNATFTLGRTSNQFLYLSLAYERNVLILMLGSMRTYAYIYLFIR